MTLAFFALLVANDDFSTQLVAVGRSALGTAHVGRRNGQIVQLEAFDVRNEERRRIQVIHRALKEALNLICVEVHGHDAGSASRFNQLGHQLGGNGNTGLVLAVLPCVAKVGDDGRHVAGRGALGGVNHLQEFKQIV